MGTKPISRPSSKTRLISLPHRGQPMGDYQDGHHPLRLHALANAGSSPHPAWWPHPAAKKRAKPAPRQPSIARRKALCSPSTYQAIRRASDKGWALAKPRPSPLAHIVRSGVGQIIANEQGIAESEAQIQRRYAGRSNASPGVDPWGNLPELTSRKPLQQVKKVHRNPDGPTGDHCGTTRFDVQHQLIGTAGVAKVTFSTLKSNRDEAPMYTEP